jgi:hypothetical protein
LKRFISFDVSPRASCPARCIVASEILKISLVESSIC